MPLNVVDRDCSAEDAYALVKKDGYVIIDRLVETATMDTLLAELSPYMEKTRFGDTDVTGTRTRRTGALVERSPTARGLIAHYLVLDITRRCLSHARSVQLSLTELISISPGAVEQFIHRDELLFDGYPFTNDYEVQVSTLWAVSDYTEEMGATRIVPGSHLLGSEEKFEQRDSVAAEMNRGSVIIYSGKLYHGGGTNQSDRVRSALNIDYAVGWVRQEENQYLSCSAEVAKALPEDLLRLMGYCAPGGHGRIYDWNDPLNILTGRNDPVSEMPYG